MLVSCWHHAVALRDERNPNWMHEGSHPNFSGTHRPPINTGKRPQAPTACFQQDTWTM